ncbi:N-acetyl sugar amidotransferase [Desulfovibrio psychrotolerans]|uniref:LPS biosynthesis protein PseA n=1 Tax=Desulfovibrio psychrotolerans TaxID=415242 RepID=A0A7J0BWN9_9BACT|nr:N-acetyl sugar amidotransferase [Desulfovibrio psychrotolerans]GFM38113.1 LPS biosynthesis protein PseA [Desulfovibrio psychrotolerans]
MDKLFHTPLPELPTIDKQLGNIPQDVFFCTKCVTSNQRPRITFNDQGICSACQWHEEKETLDWNERERMLVELLDKHRSKNGQFDCLVPSSGGKDSGFVAHMLKYRYGMNPLTVTWSPFMYTDIGFRNFNNMIHTGFDNIQFTPNGIFHRKLSRISFECNGDNFDPFVYGQKSFVFNIAIRFNIPLIFYGENGDLEYGGSMHSKNKSHEDISDWTNTYFKGSGVQNLVSIGLENGIFTKDEIARQNTEFYRAPDPEQVNKLGAEMHWFSFYKKWIPQENYYYCVENTGFETNTERSEGTYTKYASLDDKTDGFHYYMGYIKFGMGRTTRDASMEIRNKHITREEAVALVNKYDGEYPNKHLEDFCRYIDISKEHLDAVIDKFRPIHLWEKVDNVWRLKHSVA